MLEVDCTDQEQMGVDTTMTPKSPSFSNCPKCNEGNEVDYPLLWCFNFEYPKKSTYVFFFKCKKCGYKYTKLGYADSK